jgi:predicted nucleic acid binding AN1-type Zn finger protein
MESTKVLRCEAEGCKKKLGLLGFACKCEKQFCAAHRASEVHKCTFDFQEQQKKDLLKYMSTAVRAEKIKAI